MRKIWQKECDVKLTATILFQRRALSSRPRIAIIIETLERKNTMAKWKMWV